MYDERLVSGYAEWSGEILRGQTRMGYLPQEPSPQALGEAVRTFWSQGSALTPPEEAALLRSLSLPADLPSWDRPLGRLSGGERVKLQLARLLGEQPDLLLLDEPSMGLSPLLVSEIFDIIQEINKQGVTILLVEQNAKKALSIANRAYVLETGRIVKEDDAQALLHDEAIKKAYLGE